MTPERGKHSTAGFCDKCRQNMIARTAQALTQVSIDWSHRIEQGFKNVVLVEDGEAESRCKLSGERALATRRQPRYDDESALDDQNPATLLDRNFDGGGGQVKVGLSRFISTTRSIVVGGSGGLPAGRVASCSKPPTPSP
jgi:hypothetical protein